MLAYGTEAYSQPIMIKDEPEKLRNPVNQEHTARAIAARPLSTACVTFLENVQK